MMRMGGGQPLYEAPPAGALDLADQLSSDRETDDDDRESGNTSPQGFSAREEGGDGVHISFYKGLSPFGRVLLSSASWPVTQSP